MTKRHTRRFATGLLALTVLSGSLTSLFVSANISYAESSIPSYKLLTKVYDGGPGIYKVILSIHTEVLASSIEKDSFKVLVERTYPQLNLQTGISYEAFESSSRRIEQIYLSDEQGNASEQEAGNYITIEMAVRPDDPTSSPIYYDLSATHNKYANYQYTIIQQQPLKNTEGSEVNNLTTTKHNPYTVVEQTVDEFDTSGKFNYTDAQHGDITLTYASYKPEGTVQKRPLIIWLHGAGEGGTDPRISVLANEVTALAEEPIQGYFGGAEVLVPQTPTMWMNDGSGQYTKDGSSMYTNALLALIKQYVEDNKNTIDTSRIYLGGGSNGGFMTLNLLLADPDYFAAAYPVAEAYLDAWLSDEDIAKLKQTPIWFTAAGQDQVVNTAKNTTATYKRLVAAGAPHVHYSYFDKVTDIRNEYALAGGSVQPYEYDAHWSWIYVLNNDSTKDFDGTPVIVNGKAVTLMEWLAAQRK
ncbi:prolyl oligopeptidase family serine peptidase [Paenibacillus massiliensis]|uniref:prolyl oligopeptidase family serine peptidase n=1 Tax=Paenibacillus massiliensis TaxID=225917 RepID=UPI000471B586|nr:prolyl oligopeptidase family serine peptidase [Paenibacillus massiliensis]